MKPDEIRKLLGGYATGTLTREERELLYNAALEDQELFDAIAGEEALRELLDEAGFRGELAAALSRKPPTFRERIAAWGRRPLPLALAGGIAAVTLALVIFLPPAMEKTAVREIAQNRPAEQERDAAAPLPPAPEKPAAPAALSKRPAAAPAPARTQKARAPQATKERKARESRMKGEQFADVLAGRRKMAMVEAEGALGVTRQRKAAPAPAVVAMTGAASLDTSPLTVRAELRLPDGTFDPLAPGAAARLTDAVRLRIEVPGPGYLYVAELVTGANHLNFFFGGPVTGAGAVYVPSEGGLEPPLERGPRTIVIRYGKTSLGAIENIPTSAFRGGLEEPSLEQALTEITILYR